jgi:hypothetical protein
MYNIRTSDAGKAPAFPDIYTNGKAAQFAFLGTMTVEEEQIFSMQSGDTTD